MIDSPLTALNFAPPLVEVEDLGSGCLIVRSPVPLQTYPKHLLEYLAQWASSEPERTFIAARDAADNWQKVSYQETLERVRSIAQALLDRGLDAAHPGCRGHGP